MQTKRLLLACSVSLLLHLFIFAGVGAKKPSTFQPISIRVELATYRKPIEKIPEATPPEEKSPPEDEPPEDAPSEENLPEEKPADEKPPEIPRNESVKALSMMWGKTAMINARMRQMQRFIEAARANLSAQFAKTMAPKEREIYADQKCSAMLEGETAPRVSCPDPNLSELILKKIDWASLPKPSEFGLPRLDMEIGMALSAQGIGIGFQFREAAVPR